MKTMKFKIPNHLHSIIILGIMIIYSSCGFQGRKYTTGHYWNGRNEIDFGKQKENGNKEDKAPILLLDNNTSEDTIHEAMASTDEKVPLPITSSNWRSPSTEPCPIEQPIFTVDTLTTLPKEKIPNEIPSEIIKDYQWFKWTFITKFVATIVGALLSSLAQYNLLWNIPTYFFLSIGVIAMILNVIFSFRAKKKIKPFVQKKDNPKWIKNFNFMSDINLTFDICILALLLVGIFFFAFFIIGLIFFAH